MHRVTRPRETIGMLLYRRPHLMRTMVWVSTPSKSLKIPQFHKIKKRPRSSVSFLFYVWEFHLEGRTLAFAFRLRPDPAVLRLDQAFGDGQADAQAAVMARVGRLDLIELFEHLL